MKTVEIENIAGCVIRRAHLDVLQSGVTQLIVNYEDGDKKHGCIVTTSGGVVVTGSGCDGRAIFINGLSINRSCPVNDGRNN